MRRNFLSLLAVAALFSSCQQAPNSQSEAVATEVTARTDGEGFTILFDGTNTDAWRTYKSDALDPRWAVEDGMLTLTAKGAGDIITKDIYENFELQLEWKISQGGNSGIFFHVVEHDTLKATYLTGPEMQILDNEAHKDAQIHKHRAGDNYDLHACTEETVKPAGEWNQVRLIVNQKQVEHWLNGVKVVEYVLGSPEWFELYKQSKFKNMPLYGQAGKGHIALQDHGDRVWFRNIRIKTL